MMRDDMPSCIGLDEDVGVGERDGGRGGGGMDGCHGEGGSRAGDSASTKSSKTARGIEYMWPQLSDNSAACRTLSVASPR